MSLTEVRVSRAGDPSGKTETMHYFDHLPYHPQIARFESYSSYLLRVAEGNAISTVSQLSALLKLNLTYLIQRTDIPPKSFGRLSSLTGRTENELLATTFYHLGAKFGRIKTTHRLGRFLKGSIGGHLRYCPDCLGEEIGYRLPWRFLMLGGCPRHGCELVDRCWNCDRSIQNFALPAQLVTCRACGADLRQARARKLTDAEVGKAERRLADLEFLLTASVWESEVVGIILGKKLDHLRRGRRKLTEEIYSETGITAGSMKAIFNHRPGESRGANLSDYVRLIDYLGFGIAELFEAQVVPAMRGNEELSFERYLLLRVSEGYDELAEKGVRRISQSQLARHVGFSVASLRHYESVRAFLERLSAPEVLREQRVEKEEQLLAELEKAILQLRQAGKRVTRSAVAKIMGRAAEGLKTYARVDARLREEIAGQPDREQVLLTKVMRCRQYLCSLGTQVTQEALAREVGCSPECLKRYPSIRPIMDELARDFRSRRSCRERELFELISCAETDLIKSGLPITVTTVSQYVRVSPNTLHAYPTVRARVKSLISKHQSRNRELRYVSEQDRLLRLLEIQILEDIRALRLSRRRDAILGALGISNSKVRRYPRLNQRLKELLRI